jgi:alkanesulfonate monooxygenase SsuD/methylene tetrahydromethanopterin reductase-like flavin-dependent oxidoreductase (luciferase family)
MRFGLTVPNLGEYADVELLGDLAATAEASGWDGFFLWDHVLYRREPVFAAVDPWIALSVVAMRTSRLVLGPMVTPLARRRPAVVARQVTTLDHLSHGRVVFGVGLGTPADAEFEAFGESGDARARADRLDEALAIVTGLWTGERFSFDGAHERIDRATFEPVPVQRPRPPIWVAGLLPNRRPLRRAARYEGVFDVAAGHRGPTAIAEVAAVIREARGHLDGFDIVAEGESPGPYEPAALETAGATWWFEHISWKRSPLDAMWARIKAGPPA